ncbi:hypothetical protein WR25_19590 [Diploscapter pachys]|uniref:MOSC domain-containing protein n=1 Tax=Diploscapter pachys TaxID=2018661 RepID=A0A2A2LC33_9BILA|nr:hypothetical protein WR25_19590 [Diploscapter pachys]
MCNMGACQMHLGLSDDMLMKLSAFGKECGDQMDLVDGIPTGVVRISFGRLNSEKDIDVLIQMLESCFLTKNPTEILPAPKPLNEYSPIITKLITYPIKSCMGISFDSIECTSTGLKYDRNFMISKDGIALTLKKNPELCRIKVQIEDTSLLLTSDIDDVGIQVDLHEDSQSKDLSKLCGRQQSTSSCGKTSAKWLEESIGYEQCELRRIPEDSDQSLSNSCPYLLVNEASIAVLADVINLSLEEALLRFRPNIVIRGIPPFSEDHIKFLHIDRAEFEVVDKCTRCEMICIDSETGVKDPNMIVALRNIRYKQKMTFGIYLRQVDDTKCTPNIGMNVKLEEEILTNGKSK